MDKMKMRRMAMDKMMAEGPSIAIKIKKKPMDMEDMGEKKDEKGYIQMAVTPAEKEMIMASRKEEMGEDESMDMEDSEGEYA